jgi:hypothetical protein
VTKMPSDIQKPPYVENAVAPLPRRGRSEPGGWPIQRFTMYPGHSQRLLHVRTGVSHALCFESADSPARE